MDGEQPSPWGWVPSLSEEEIEEAKKQHDRAVMKSEEYTAAFRRLISEELNYDQLETMHTMVQHIASSNNLHAIISWYEGMIFGALTVRDVRLSEKPGEGLAG